MPKQQPPGPKRFPWIGNMLAFNRDRLGTVVDLAAHGDIASMPILWKNHYLITRPDLVQQCLLPLGSKMQKDYFTHQLSKVMGWGLISSEGELWKRQRKLVSHAFTPKRIAAYAGPMVAATERTLRDWHDGAVLDINHEMSALTLDIVGRTLFDADVREDAKEVGDALHIISKYFVEVIEKPIAPPEWWPSPGNRRFYGAVRKVDNIVRSIIEARRQSGQDHGDLLSALLQAQDEEGGMSDQQLRDECVTLFLAGHETTALTLTYSFYALAGHPDIEAKVVEEVNRVLGDRAATYEDIKNLEYTERAIKEAMRIYPPVWIFGRELTEDIELDGYTLEKGSTLLFSQWITQRRADVFEDPARFDPDRWLPERAKQLHKFAYFPFGGGPRICIGNHFAMMEAVLALATLIREFQLERVDDKPLDFFPAVTLRPARDVPMRLRKRRKAPARAA